MNNITQDTSKVQVFFRGLITGYDPFFSTCVCQIYEIFKPFCQIMDIYLLMTYNSWIIYLKKYKNASFKIHIDQIISISLYTKYIKCSQT